MNNEHQTHYWLKSVLLKQRWDQTRTLQWWSETRVLKKMKIHIWFSAKPWSRSSACIPVMQQDPGTDTGKTGKRLFLFLIRSFFTKINLNHLCYLKFFPHLSQAHKFIWGKTTTKKYTWWISWGIKFESTWSTHGFMFFERKHFSIPIWKIFHWKVFKFY